MVTSNKKTKLSLFFDLITDPENFASKCNIPIEAFKIDAGMLVNIRGWMDQKVKKNGEYARKTKFGKLQFRHLLQLTR